MSETPKKVNVDAALREWPDVEKPAKEWDEFAATIEARVARGERGVTIASVADEDLFADPLGQMAEDGHNSAGLVISGSTPDSGQEGPTMTMPVDRERDRRSLQDLAKMAQMTPPPPSVRAAPSVPSGVIRAAEAQKDDSGLVDLAVAAASDPAAETRAKSTPLASQGLFDDEPASIRPGPMGAVAQPAPSIPPMPASMPPQSTSAPLPSISSAPIAPQAPAATSSQVVAAPHAQKSGKGGVVVALVLGGLVAVSAAAAGGFMFLKHRAQSAAVAATTTTQPATPAAQTPAPQQANPAATVAAAADPATAGADDATDLNSLPNGTKPTTGGKRLALAAKGAPAKDPSAAFAPAPEAPKAPEQPKLAQKDLPKTDNAPAGDLGKAMQSAVGDKNDKSAAGDPTPAAGGTQFAPGSVPQKPSQGAVTGAIGSVLPGARACLGPDDPVSHASITFGSNGSVQSVAVSGAAAGKPAEACIKGALMKAKVQPFAEPSYTARITVRH